MAEVVTIKVSGLRELGLAFQELSADMQKKVARAAANAGAQVIKKLAIQKAPESTGNLKKNIIVKRLEPSQTTVTEEYIVTVRQGRAKSKQRSALRKAGHQDLIHAAGVGDAYYAKFLEFGTVKMPPHPFLRPAIDQGKETAAHAVKDRLKSRIDKANKK